METIKYQGQEIQAQLIHDFGGSDMGDRHGHKRAGCDELWRDTQGNYYARQYRYDEGEGARDRQLHRFWESTHRLSLKGAILWMVSVSSADGLPLRQDAAALLMKNKVQSGNVHLDAEVPADFEAEANRLGFSAKEYLWRLAEDALARPPQHVQIVQDDPPASAALLEALPVHVTQDCRRFTFDYPATEKRCGIQCTVDLSDEQMERARELAAVFGLDLAVFLRGLVNYNALPGQPRCSDEKVKDLLQAEHITFTCTDATLANRIKRAAQSRGQSVDEFVAYSLGCDVDMWEEAILVHPVTGELLDADYEDLYGTVTKELLDPEGNPYSSQPVGTCVHLDTEAAALVRRYLKVTPWEFTAADLINGCVVHSLEMAFDTLAEAVEMGHLDSQEYHDGGWGYVEEDIVDATLRRTGKEGVAARRGWSKEEIEAEILPGTKVVAEVVPDFRVVGRRDAKPDPADVALLAAAAPEEEPLPEEEHTDEPGAGTATQDGKEVR